MTACELTVKQSVSFALHREGITGEKADDVASAVLESLRTDCLRESPGGHPCLMFCPESGQWGFTCAR